MFDELPHEYVFYKHNHYGILDDKKFSILKKGNRDWKWKYANKLEIKKVWKQVKDGAQWS